VLAYLESIKDVAQALDSYSRDDLRGIAKTLRGVVGDAVFKRNVKHHDMVDDQ
jgi:hypothetical protein